MQTLYCKDMGYSCNRCTAKVSIILLKAIKKLIIGLFLSQLVQIGRSPLHTGSFCLFQQLSCLIQIPFQQVQDTPCMDGFGAIAR